MMDIPVYQVTTYTYGGNIATPFKEEFARSSLTRKQFTCLGKFLEMCELLYIPGLNIVHGEALLMRIYQISGLSYEYIQCPMTKYDTLYNFLIDLVRKESPFTYFVTSFELINGVLYPSNLMTNLSPMCLPESTE